MAGANLSGGSPSSRPTLSTERLTGQPGLHRETMDLTELGISPGTALWKKEKAEVRREQTSSGRDLKLDILMNQPASILGLKTVL